MNKTFTAVILTVVMAGCASPSLHSKRPPAAGSPAKTPSPSVTTPEITRVTLPYTFVRHGIEIRVNSVEFAETGMLVNIGLQETRGESLDFSLATLIQSRQTTGEILTYAGYNLSGKTHTDPVIHMAPHDQIAVALSYASPPGNANNPGPAYELKFPTGRYWSSQTAAEN